MNKCVNDGFHFFLKSRVGVEAPLFWLRLSSLHGTRASPLSSGLPVYLAVWLLWKAGGSGWETDLLHRPSFSRPFPLRGKDHGTHFSGGFSDHPRPWDLSGGRNPGLRGSSGRQTLFFQLEGGVTDYSEEVKLHCIRLDTAASLWEYFLEKFSQVWENKEGEKSAFGRSWTEHTAALPSPPAFSAALQMSSINFKDRISPPRRTLLKDDICFLVFYYVHFCVLLQFFSQMGWQFKSCNLNKVLMFSAFQNACLQSLLLSSHSMG